METIVIHDAAAADVQPAAIIGAEPPLVAASFFDLDLTSPTHSEVLTLWEAWPLATGIGICHRLRDSVTGYSATIQLRNALHVLDVVEVLLKEAFLSRGRWRRRWSILFVCTLRLAKVGPGVVVAIMIVELNGVRTGRFVKAHEAIS